MQLEFAQVSLPGNRQDNQDRVEIITKRRSALIVAADGMGGHTAGAKASELIVATLQQRFTSAGELVLDPQGFLALALGEAHDRVVALGEAIEIEQRPRATCAVCLVQDASAYCAHVGDSRIYVMRRGGIVSRSRDHSHVELLLREGLIGAHEVSDHPMRNFVECCLGGDQPIPDMSIAGRQRLEPGDVVLVCTDGFWSGLDEASIGQITEQPPTLAAALHALAEAAIARNAPHSDNTSAVALRWNGEA